MVTQANNEMPKSNFKHQLFAEFARVGKALSHGNRLELIEFIAQGEQSVEELAKKSGLTTANTSQHLQQLRHAGLVTTRKDGLKVFYSLSGDDVITLLDALRTVAERHVAEVDRLVSSFLYKKDDLEPIHNQELLDRVNQGIVTIIDVRPAEEFQSGHIAGAINIPATELENGLDELPAEKEIVAYCRGPHCVLAFDAVEKLRSLGRDARRLEAGFPEWRQAGLPIETSDT